MRGVRHARDGEGAVVAGDADARGRDELADCEAVGRSGLNGGGAGTGGASAGCGESRDASDVSKLRAGGNGDDGESAVIGADRDTREGHGLAGGKAVRRGGGDGDEETIFGGASGRVGDGDSGWLGGAAGARDYRRDHVFVNNGWTGAGTYLAHAVEIGVVELTREIVAGLAVTDGEIFAAEK